MSFAAEILGYPIAPEQAVFYIFILGVIGASITLVAVAYVSFWLADPRKKNKVKLEKFVFLEDGSFCDSIKRCATLLRGENSLSKND